MTDPTPLPLAAEFPAATRDDWRKLVDSVLKGAPFTRLESRTRDGLTIEPLYDRAAAAPVVTGRAPGAAWTVMQRVDHPDPSAANVQALDDLENGATGLQLVFAGSPSADGFGLDGSKAALARTLDSVHLDAGVAIDLDLSAPTRQVVRDFTDLVKSRGYAAAAVDLRIGFNPIGAFATAGRSGRSWDATAQDFAAAIGGLRDAGFRGPFAVGDGRIVHNAGGSEAQELAFMLASAVAYLRALEASGMALETARDAIYFRLSADAEQFLTTAKFRAARKLWNRVEAACGLSPKPALIAAETAWRMMTRRDPYVNMLRATIAVAAAGFGGADSVAVLPHTAPLGLPDALARRIARNTQLVLLEESNLARVADPAAGSGALEALTAELCAAAWSQFQEIEHQGGVWSALESGLIQRRVASVRAEGRKAIAHRADVLTGTNQFPDIDEAVPPVLEITPAPAPRDEPIDGTSTALPRIRFAEPFERLRDASDSIQAQTGVRPTIFLANLGALADFTARATFAKNFFESGGIQTIGHDGQISTLAAAFKASGAALACLCASDKIYQSDGPGAAAALKAAGARCIYLAGRPGEHENALRKAGVQSFIFAGCDALATLRAAYDILGTRIR